MIFIAHLLISQHLLIAHQTCKDDGKAAVSEIKFVASNLQLVCPQVSWKCYFPANLPFSAILFPSVLTVQSLPQFFSSL